MDTRIAIDWDGTCVRAMDLVCHMINFKYGTNFTARDILEWDFFHKKGYGEDFYRVYDMMDTAGLRSILRPYDHYTGGAIVDLSKRYTVDIVTCNESVAEGGIRDWLDQHAPGHEVRDVVTMGRKEPKEKIALEYDIFIDDNPGLAEEFVKQDDASRLLLLANARWNERRFEWESPSIHRFRSWADILAISHVLKIYQGV